AAGVQATVVNIGTNGNNDFRLSLVDNKMEDATIQLSSLDGTSPTDTLLDPMTPGSPITYRINGKPPADSDPLSTDTSTITLAPGVSVALRGTGSTTITVAQNANSVQVALQSFVNAYNTVQAEVNTNRGQGKGALKGDSILSTLSEMMHQFTGYATGTDGISSLTALGVQFNQDGSLSFDSSIFSAATQGQMAQLASFLGSTDSGGFLKTANDVLTGLTDSSQGLFATTAATLKSEITHDNQT